MLEQRYSAKLYFQGDDAESAVHRPLSERAANGELKGCRVKILLVCAQYQYGRSELGESIEYTAFLPALRHLGHRVSFFESWAPQGIHDYLALNRSLIREALNFAPDVMFVVQRDYEIWLETLDYLRDHTGIATQSWTTDDSWKYREVSRFIAPHYDVITTTYKNVLPKYHKDKNRNVVLTQWAANSAWLFEPLPSNECDFSVSFVGAARPARREAVKVLTEQGVDVACFGHGWPNGAVSAEEIPDIMRRSKVSLNFADSFKNKKRPQLKARTFEVPGAGGLLLSEAVPDLEDYYKIGEEIVAFASHEDLVNRVRFLLSNPNRRDEIAWAGHRRTVKEHTYENRFAPLLEMSRQRKGCTTPKLRDLGYEYLTLQEKSYALGPGLRVLKKLFLFVFCILFGSTRGPRAARRCTFELSWRVFGEKTFRAAGLPGRMFPFV